MEGTNMPLLNRDGVGIYYESHGQGPAILLSHGYSATCRMWDGQIAALRDRFRVIVWDMRGHGQSDVPADPSAYSEAATVGDMAALLQACEVESAGIAGLSLGGYMSLAFHARHPAQVRALAVRHRSRLSQRCRARHMERAGAGTRGRTGCARLRGIGQQRRGAHEPAPLARGPGRRGARDADAAG
jgi:pimeloyl-ACP methyl ester carboxylesterase